MRNFLTISIVGYAALCVGSIYAGPQAPASLKYLLENSDAIIVGTASGTVVRGKADVSLSIMRSLKGELLNREMIPLTWEGSGSISTRVEPLRGLFFLKKTAGAWYIIPAMGGAARFEQTFFVISNPDLPSDSERARAQTVGDKVFLELLAIVENPPAPQYGAWLDLVGAYRDLASPFTERVLRDYNGNSSRILATALRSQVIRGDVAGLTRLERDQATIGAAPFLAEAVEDLRTIYKSTDPTGIAILGRLVSSPDAKLRRASATALARIHTSPTLPILANLLDSNDLMLQTYAVGGLAMFANNVPIGLHEPAVGGWPYRTDETIAHSAMDERLLKERPAYYIGFWKSWWAENRAKLGY